MSTSTSTSKPFRPMLAYDCEGDMRVFGEHLRQEGMLLASFKLDGIRAIVKGGKLLSRTLKPIRNAYTQATFGTPELEGLDGELIVGKAYGNDVMYRTSSGVMSHGGKPNVWFHVFDLWNRGNMPYIDCLTQLEGSEPFDGPFSHMHPFVVVHKQHRIKSIDDLLDLEERAVTSGYEGLIVRTPRGLYKYGRSTAREGYLGKLKRFKDSEGRIIEVQELMRNLNIPTVDARGFQVRDAKKAGMVGASMAGVLMIQDLHNPKWVCGVGSGLNDELRRKIWLNRKQYIGRIIKYKYLPHGTVEAPRHPVFLGFRDPDDL